MAASFTLWVQDENPDQTYLLALLLRVCKEQPGSVTQEFQQYAQGRLDHSHKLSYQVSHNYSKGGCNVAFTLHPYTASKNMHYGPVKKLFPAWVWPLMGRVAFQDGDASYSSTEDRAHDGSYSASSSPC